MERRARCARWFVRPTCGVSGAHSGGRVWTSCRPGLPGSGDRGRRSPQRPHARCRAPAQHTRTTRALTRAPRQSRVDNHESNRVPCVHNRVWLSSRIVNRVTRARRARELRTRNTRAPEPRSDAARRRMPGLHMDRHVKSESWPLETRLAGRRGSGSRGSGYGD